jgi:hypothetical protein
VLLEITINDPSPPVAAAAASVIADVATGGAETRALVTSRVQDDAGLRSRLAGIYAVVDTAVERAEGIVTVPPCTGQGRWPFGDATCNRATATTVDLCSGPLPKSANIRATRVFTKWSDEPRPWERAEAALNADGDWNSFGGAETRDVDADTKRVCVPFRQWSSHQSRDARIEVTYAK